MFKFEEICELIQLVGSTGVAGVEVEHAGSRVRIDGRAQIATAPAAVSVPSSAAPAATVTSDAVAPAAAGEAAADGEEDLHTVNSPIVGTFYRAPSPDADPYVRVGDFIEKGQTLCIVEAMKLMNEIESDFAGTVVEVLVENGNSVEFGQKLFKVRRS